jgi:hypothetical protein
LKRLFLLLAGFALTLPAAPVAAQMVPGLPAPRSVRAAVNEAWIMGCFFAATDRPAVGLNLPLGDLAGPGLHAPTSIPDELRAFIDTLADDIVTVMLDAPDGAAWRFFDTGSKRCTVVPQPATSEGIEAEFRSLVRPDQDWRPVTRAGGGAAFELDFDAAPTLGRPGGRLRAWYQAAAGPASPQMIVVERVR